MPDNGMKGGEIILDTRPRLLTRSSTQAFGETDRPSGNMFGTETRFWPIPKERNAPAVDINIGIHVSGDGDRKPHDRPWWTVVNCRNMCWLLLVILLAAVGIGMTLAGQLLMSSSTGRIVEETTAIAQNTPPHVTVGAQSSHLELVDSLLRHKSRRMKQSVDLAFAFADQARGFASQEEINDDPGLLRAIESLPKPSDPIFSTLDGRLKALSHKLQDILDSLDHIKLTIEDASFRMDGIERDLPRATKSLLGRWWWRKTKSYITLRARIDAILVLGRVTTPLIQSFTGQVAYISGTIDAFRGDVKGLCSRYTDLDPYITLQARLLKYKINDHAALNDLESPEACVSTDEYYLGGTCSGSSPNSDAIMSVGDSMAAMSSFCGEVSRGISQTLVLGDEYEGDGGDEVDDDELLQKLQRRVGVAVREHEVLLDRARHLSEVV